jgi:hypothetical protein
VPVTKPLGEYPTQSQEERNYGVLRSWFPRWVWNTGCNHPLIKKEFESGYDYSLASYQNKMEGPAIIVGAGPSFDEGAPLLKNWRGALFAPESMAKTCLGWGRQPEYIGLFDAGMTRYFMQDVNWKGSKLLTHPAVNPVSLSDWKWEKIYYIMMHQVTVDLQYIVKNKGTITINQVVDYVKDQVFGGEFFEHINPILYPFINAMILNAGCVVNNMVQIAHFMGYSPLFLLGVDFGYPGEKMRSDMWKIPKRRMMESDRSWKKRWKLYKPDHLTTMNQDRLAHVSENGIITSAEQIDYKLALLSIYKVDKPQMFDCSNGILTEFIKKDIREVIRNGGKGYEKEYRDGGEIERICDAYYFRQQELASKRDVNRKRKKVRSKAG